MNAQLVLLLTSPRVAGGLLTRAGWQVIEAADAVLCDDVTDPLPAAVLESGIALAQLDPSGPGPRARELVDQAQTRQVVWLGSPDGDPGLTDALADELSRVAQRDQPPAVEVLVASHDVPGARLLDLVAVMDRLRSPGGCPWDAEQTHQSLVPYLVEEAYEAAEALEAGDPAAVREELGDVLLQVVFHARMAQEADQPFDVDDVAAEIVAKLVRRHPHVFAADGAVSGAAADAGVVSGAAGPEPAAGHDGATAARTRTAAQVQASWDQLKAAEKGRASILDGIPLALPALARADKVLGRLDRAGVLTDVLAQPVGDPVADQAIALVRAAQSAGVDAESALRAGVRELERRQREKEATA
ncbi:MazG family protein [Angustibacter sp. McL0619]|uniref:MazG family protein n=1 Tax=Angustibacter sp. McL0619 TaxID=3415676 RepID=UPI003CEBE132